MDKQNHTPAPTETPCRVRSRARRYKTLAYALLPATVLAGPAAAQTELTVYTAIEAEDLKKYAEAFEAANPDIKINWVRDSTGVVTAKLLAEKTGMWGWI